MTARARLAAHLGVAALALAGADKATAEPGGWSDLSVADVEALHRSIVTLHPGMRDPTTPDFASRVEGAYVAALARARVATSYADWRDATRGFMLAFRDGHSIFRPTVASVAVRWPGFLIDGRRDGWVVRRPAGVEGAATAPREGSRLIGCDGVDATTLLRARLDARQADWSKEPERLRQAYRLFLDDGAGAPPLRTCTFNDAVGTETTTLDWKVRDAGDFTLAIRPFTREMKRPIATTQLPDGGRWIALGSFGDEVALERLAKALEGEREMLRATPYIVLDLRGNRGGNSGWGDRFARVIWGDATVAAIEQQMEYDTRAVRGKLWRASSEAQGEVRRSAAEFADEGPAYASVAGYWQGVADLIAKAPQGDAALVDDPCCGADPQAKPPAVHPPALYAKPVFLLIDSGCFSSCVLGAGTPLAMGAIPVGEPSGQNEEYGEVAGPLTVPSGLARYLVPLAIIRQRRDALIVRPRERWAGAMDDDEGLRTWIATLAGKTGSLTRTPRTSARGKPKG